MLGTALIVGFALFLVRSLALEAIFQRAKRTALSVRFPVGVGLRIIFRIGGPFLMLVGYKMARQALGPFDQMMALLVGAMGIGCIIGEPGEIVATPAGLAQTFLLGLKKRIISWEGAAASHPRGSREVTVIGGDGTTITHSQYHVGQSEFLHELVQRHVYIQ